ncbi:glycosyltransferase [Holospora undulata]|uniref:Lipopolysaccharide core biosynthesis mannosyltransferase LpcC n=1 Tax=Holospora undulata HU1 TaxID=1321371 RepID=A0A061JHV2_9PROT|nr:glycosyltransferase [Holospora undulata]ETZ05067.1 lipopolysaccharide core biosynthesis mannosyltransferase LpcC [Holospora undulata HU1]
MNNDFFSTITKPKIAYVVPGLDRGGCEMHLLSLLPELKKWFSVHIFILHHHSGALGPLFKEQGIGLTCLLSSNSDRYGKVRRWIQGTLCLRKHLSMGVDILHAFLPSAYCSAGFACLLNKKVKHFLMSRRALNFYSEHRYVLRKLEKFLHQRVCLALGNSSEVCRQLIEEGVPFQKVCKIFNGLPVRPYSLQKETTQLLEIQTVPLNWVKIAYVANFMAYKGHHDLIFVAKSLVSLECCNFCFLLAGRDCNKYVDCLKNEIKNQGLEAHFRFLGEISDSTFLLQYADMGVFPSHEEGFSNSLLEKMAQGLAVVATDVGGNKDAIISGENGYLVPVGQTGVMAQHLALLISDPVQRSNIGKSAQKTVDTLFTLKQCVNNYYTMYQNVLSFCRH